VFQVCDQGIGIPESDVAQLFQTFHRGSNVGERPGSGLGLVIVKRCVELHGGTISLVSPAGAGTTVTVRLPLFSAIEPPDSRHRPRSRPVSPAAAKPRSRKAKNKT
jgi:signal transduction histidine kinase